jgi:type II secretory pathway pseudopilin PulG
MMEDTAQKVSVLTTLHNDLAELKTAYLSFSRKMLLVVSVLALISIAALGIGVSLYGEVSDAQDRAASAVAATALQAAQNAILIKRLDRVAELAQLAGARADAVQCREINKLKQAIRGVIRSSPNGQSTAADDAAARFQPSKCSSLPNAEPVTP